MKNSDGFRLLLIETNLIEIRLMQELLNDCSPPFYVSHVKTFPEAIQQIHHTHFDVALVDAISSDTQILDSLHQLNQKNIQLPVILLLDIINENFINIARRQGVRDYMIKHKINQTNLAATVHHVISRTQAAKILTPHIPIHSPRKDIDQHTCLYNKKSLTEHLEYEVKRAQQLSTVLALIFISIENLQGLYSDYGSVTTDAFISAYVSRLKNIVRSNDLIGRYSDNEFGSILIDVASEQNVNIVIHKMLLSLSKPIQIFNQTISTTTKLGLALYPKHSTDSTNLIHYAYFALTSARKQPGTTYEVYNNCISPLAIKHLKVSEAVRYAIEKQQLQLRFQPIINLSDKKIITADVQIYWQHADYSEITTKDFMFLAELGGLIWPITECIFRKICEQYLVWKTQGLDPVTMRIHIPSVLLQKKNFPQMLNAVLEELGVTANVLELTVSLSVLRLNSDETKSVLNSLDIMGIKLLLDDFGNHRTSLYIIARYPISGIIINKQLVAQATDQINARKLIKTILGLCQSMKLSVTASGIDTPEQNTLINKWHCDQAQGKLYGKSVNAEQFSELMRLDLPENIIRIENTIKPGQQAFITQYIDSLNFLPPMPDSLKQLLRLRNHVDLKVHDLCMVLIRDPAITAQLIRYANAPFFGNQGRIKTLDQAVMTALGLEGALNMAMGIALMGQVQAYSKDYIDLLAFWQHAIFSATLSQSIASLLPATTVTPGTAFLSGLLQNIGYLVLCKDFSSQIKQARQELRYNPELVITEVEKQIIGTNHVEVGLYLLRNWQLPEEIVTAVFEHHNISYIGPYAIYPNIILIANRLLAPAHLTDETVSYIPPAMLQIHTLQETQLMDMLEKVMHQRDRLDTLSRHLAA